MYTHDFNPERTGMELFFLIPGNINALTGGYLYNRYMVEGMRKKGHVVEILQLDECMLQAQEIEAKCSLIFKKLRTGSIVLIDSLVLGVLHRVMKKFHGKLTFMGIIHLPLSYNPLADKKRQFIAKSEVEAMQHTSRLIVTGRLTFRLLTESGISSEIIILIEPGVEDFPRKQHYAAVPSQLLCISNYSPVKDQLLLARALCRLRTRNWTLHMYGNTNTDKEYVDRLNTFIVREKLNDRIFLHDVIQRKNISGAFLASDLFVLPTQFETYGMVLSESLAHGIPLVTTTSGNISETVPPTMGRFIEPGNLENMVSALEELFTDQQLYKSLCKSAADYYKQASPWQTSIDKLERIISEV